jgi:hypothetical protein
VQVAPEDVKEAIRLFQVSTMVAVAADTGRDGFSSLSASSIEQVLPTTGMGRRLSLSVGHE